VGWEKVACWSIKAAIALKRLKIEEKLLTNAFSNGTIPDPLRPSLPQYWGFATPTQNFNRYYLRNGRGYGLQIWPEHAYSPSEEKPIKIMEKRERGSIQRLPIFGLATQKQAKNENFKFCTHIDSIHRKKSPLKISGKVGLAVGIVRDSRKFSGHSYIGRIARSSLR